MEQTHKAQQDVELNEALSIIEIEERFEFTAVAADSLRCGNDPGTASKYGNTACGTA